MHPIETVHLKSGPTPDATLSIGNPAVTVFVGPNNSGKSLVLRELQSYLISGTTNRNFHILADLDFSTLDQIHSEQILASLLEEAGLAVGIPEDTSFQMTRGNTTYGMTPKSVADVLAAPQQNKTIL